MYPVDSGLFVASCIPKIKYVDHSENGQLSEQQLEFVNLSEMKEFAK